MKIEEICEKDRGGNEKYTLKIDGERMITIGCLSECPEDAMLERDLNFVYEIVPLMKKAYEAGRNGEALEETHE